jgi:hypothetical protein
MLCEIINPSDRYTLETDNFDAAAVAIAMLGNGKLGLQSLEDDELSTPILFGWDSWLRDRGIDLDKFIPENLEPMAAALESVVIGDESDRRGYLGVLKACDNPAKWQIDYHDEHRSSMNDIGRAAWNLAECLRKKIAERSADT